MAKSTFWDVIIRTIEKAATPLTAKEIWQKAHELDTLGDFETTGKTPWDTIAAYCAVDIMNKGEKATVYRAALKPTRFFLTKLKKGTDVDKLVEEKVNEEIKKEKKEDKKFNERDLHPLLATFARTHTHFKALIKTIFHENSLKTTKGKNEWLHPDQVGVYFPFEDYIAVTRTVQRHLSISSVRLFSFELKKTLNFGNLREYYFQAVSNSSWANEGYLVTLTLDDDPSFIDELRRLNNAFGIGVIQLDPENIHESEITLPARTKTELDWDTINRLASENSDFSEFLDSITEDIQVGKIKSHYDRCLEGDDLPLYIQQKGILTA